MVEEGAKSQNVRAVESATPPPSIPMENDAQQIVQKRENSEPTFIFQPSRCLFKKKTEWESNSNKK